FKVTPSALRWLSESIPACHPGQAMVDSDSVSTHRAEPGPILQAAQWVPDSRFAASGMTRGKLIAIGSKPERRFRSKPNCHGPRLRATVRSGERPDTAMWQQR